MRRISCVWSAHAQEGARHVGWRLGNDHPVAAAAVSGDHHQRCPLEKEAQLAGRSTWRRSRPGTRANRSVVIGGRSRRVRHHSRTRIRGCRRCRCMAHHLARGAAWVFEIAAPAARTSGDSTAKGVGPAPHRLMQGSGQHAPQGLAGGRREASFAILRSPLTADPSDDSSE
jgi:hypothetical protein